MQCFLLSFATQYVGGGERCVGPKEVTRKNNSKQKSYKMHVLRFRLLIPTITLSIASCCWSNHHCARVSVQCLVMSHICKLLLTNLNL